MSVTRRGILLGAAALAAGVGTRTAWTQPPEAPRIEAGEAVKLVAQGEAVVVDVRDKAAFDGNHAVDARHIPVAEIANRLSELPKDKLIAAYCT
jgi:hypothetical protein